MPSKTVDKEELILALSGDSERIEVLKDSLIDSSRWSLIYEVIFLDGEDGKTWSTTYTTGATENQDQGPFEYDDEMVPCIEMEAAKIVVETYKVKA